MRLAILYGVVVRLVILYGAIASILVAFILAGVAAFRQVKETSLQREEAYKLACESTGGKIAWNFKHWECLK